MLSARARGTSGGDKAAGGEGSSTSGLIPSWLLLLWGGDAHVSSLCRLWNQTTWFKSWLCHPWEVGRLGNYYPLCILVFLSGCKWWVIHNTLGQRIVEVGWVSTWKALGTVPTWSRHSGKLALNIILYRVFTKYCDMEGRLLKCTHLIPNFHFTSQWAETLRGELVFLMSGREVVAGRLLSFRLWRPLRFFPLGLDLTLEVISTLLEEQKGNAFPRSV